MNKSFVSASITSVLAMASASALAAGPDFYGRLDLAVTNADNGSTLQSDTNGAIKATDNGTYFENNFSYLGVKGSEKLTDGFDVIYQMEFGVENTTIGGNNDPFNARNTFLGVKTSAGAVLVGRNDTVFKQSEGGFDLFANTNADIDRLVASQTRSADAVWYYSPKIADLLTINATYLMADNQTERKYENGKKNGGAQYAVSATLGDKKLKAQNFYVAAAYNDGISNIEAYRAVGQVKLGEFKLGGLYQHAKNQTYHNRKGNTYFVNLSYNLNGVNLKAEYGHDESGLGKYFRHNIANIPGTIAPDYKKKLTEIDDVKVNQITVGADYRLSKSTLVYGHYAHYEGDFKQKQTKYDLDTDNIFTIGMRYDF